MDKAITRVRAMTDAQLSAVWGALREYDPQEDYSPGVSMDEWAELVYSEMCSRGLGRGV